MTGETDQQTIGGKTVAVWNEEWEPVPNGFKVLQSDLRWVPGLFAAKSEKGIAYIGAATQKAAGLRAGLARARLKLQTGNSSHGLRLVRAAGDEVEAYVIRMEPPITPKDIVALKWALIDLHKPSMNAPRDLVTAARKAAYANRS